MLKKKIKKDIYTELFKKIYWENNNNKIMMMMK